MSRIHRNSIVTLTPDKEVQFDKDKITADMVLDSIGPKSIKVWKVFLLAGISWAVTAPGAMVGAFVDDVNCDYSNLQNLSNVCIHRQSVDMSPQFGLTASKNADKNWFTTVFMLGNILGGSLMSLISDRYGRKSVVVAGLFLQGIFTVLTYFVWNYGLVLFLRFLQGVFFTGSGVAVWILGYESVPSVFRPYTTFFFGSTWVLGYVSIAPLAYLLNDWRYLMLTIGVPCILYSFICLLFLPESFHFLVTKKKHDEAFQWIKEASNEKFASTIPLEFLVKEDKEKIPIKEQIRKIITNRKLVIRTVIFAFIWLTDVLVYFGMSLFSVSLSGDKYISYTLIGLIEIPAVATGPILMNKFGRRFTVSLTHFITFCAFTLASFVLTNSSAAQLMFWLVAKFAIASAFMCIYAFASESFPTTERNLCIGLCSDFGKLVGSCAPFIQTTSQIYTKMPLLIFGLFSCISGFLTLILDETNHKNLPDTLDSIF